MESRNKIRMFASIILEMLAFLVMIIFLGFWVFRFFGLIFIDRGSGAIEGILISFTGAFFAFLFVRIADWLNAIYIRQKKHYNALIMIEYSLIELNVILEDDLYVLRGLLEAADKEEVVVCWSNTHSLPIDQIYKADLSNIALINQLLSFYIDVRKFNDDMETLLMSRNELRMPLLTNAMPAGFYSDRMKEATNEMVKPLEAFSTKLSEELLDLIAAVRLRIKYDMPLFIRAYSIISGFHKKLEDKELSVERAQIQKELDESKRESGEK